MLMMLEVERFPLREDLRDVAGPSSFNGLVLLPLSDLKIQHP
jgi:hypothetical protein